GPTQSAPDDRPAPARHAGPSLAELGAPRARGARQTGARLSGEKTRGSAAHRGSSSALPGSDRRGPYLGRGAGHALVADESARRRLDRLTELSAPQSDAMSQRWTLRRLRG